MPVKIAKVLIRLIILLLTFECVSPAFSVDDAADSRETTLHQAHVSGPLSIEFLFEKEEEERTEEERDHFTSVVLVDFSRVANSLRIHFKAHTNILFDEHRQGASGGLFRLFCIFLI